MNPELISSICDRIGPIRWIDRGIDGFRGWFLLETNPLPPVSQRAMVLADTLFNRPLNVTGAKLYHSALCTSEDHQLNWRYKRALETIEDTTFFAVVYPGEPNVFNGQPVVIVIDPPITYDLYPDHPHLNQAYVSDGRVLPDSICYTDNPTSLGTNDYDRLYSAIREIPVWLFRHQVWVETRKLRKPGRWIGPAASGFDPMFHALRLDPNGPCYCNSDKLYRNCHLNLDVKRLKSHYSKEANIRNPNINRLITSYREPHLRALSRLRKVFLGLKT